MLIDLDRRSVLDTTRSSGWASRDHWPQCYTVLMAGGGVEDFILLQAATPARVVAADLGGGI